ncbi:MAG: hypothetical protein WA830_21255 [Candidatus Sulfotelmatobacter sp.]
MRSKTQFRDSGKNQPKLRFRLSPRRAPTFAGTQRGKILALLIAASGGWFPLTEILSLGIAQYGARILELRRMGFDIENRSEYVDGGRHSWFRLLKSPAPAPTPSKPEPEWKDRPRLTGLPLFDLAARQ